MTFKLIPQVFIYSCN